MFSDLKIILLRNQCNPDNNVIEFSLKYESNVEIRKQISDLFYTIIMRLLYSVLIQLRKGLRNLGKLNVKER